MAWSTTDRAFKTLISKRTTSSGKAFYEEIGDNTINVSIDEVWSSTISSTPSQAVIDGVAELRTLFTLTEDTSVGSQQSYYAYDSVRLKDWISDKYGTDYAVKLYQNNGTQIFPTDPSTWFFDYQTGILTFNGSTASFSKPFKITAYRYIGSKGSSLTGLSDGRIPFYKSDTSSFYNSPFRTDSTAVNIDSTASGEARLLFSTGQLAMGQLDGGVYFGGVGIKENQWEISNTDTTWAIPSELPNMGFNRVAMSSDGRIITAVSDNGMWDSSNYGVDWTSQRISEGHTFYALAMSSDGKIQTIGSLDDGKIYVSRDYGTTWAEKGFNAIWWSASMSSDGKYQAVAPWWVVSPGDATLLMSSDYGDTWNPSSLTTPPEVWQGNVMSSDGKIHAVATYPQGGDGHIYISYDYGNTWSPKADSSKGFQNISMTADGKIQAVIEGDYTRILWISTDYGMDWTNTGKDADDVKISSDGRILMIADGTSAIISEDHGKTWGPRQGNFASTVILSMSSDGKLKVACATTDMYINYADSKTRGNIIATEKIQAKTAKLTNLSSGYVKSDSSGILTSTATVPWSDITGITGDSVHPLTMGSYYLWVDASGRLRLKNSAPSSESDGTIVGSQSS